MPPLPMAARIGFVANGLGELTGAAASLIAVFPPYTHNPGMAGDEAENIVLPHTLVGFGAPYGLADVNNWGQWDLYGVYVNAP